MKIILNDYKYVLMRKTLKKSAQVTRLITKELEKSGQVARCFKELI